MLLLLLPRPCLLLLFGPRLLLLLTVGVAACGCPAGSLAASTTAHALVRPASSRAGLGSCRQQGRTSRQCRTTCALLELLKPGMNSPSQTHTHGCSCCMQTIPKPANAPHCLLQHNPTTDNTSHILPSCTLKLRVWNSEKSLPSCTFAPPPNAGIARQQCMQACNTHLRASARSHPAPTHAPPAPSSLGSCPAAAAASQALPLLPPQPPQRHAAPRHARLRWRCQTPHPHTPSAPAAAQQQTAHRCANKDQHSSQRWWLRVSHQGTAAGKCLVHMVLHPSCDKQHTWTVCKAQSPCSTLLAARSVPPPLLHPPPVCTSTETDTHL